MYRIDNKVYADAGKYLIDGKNTGYVFNYKDGIEERSIDLSKMTISGPFVKYGDFYHANKKSFNYAQWKTHIIKWRYNNDEQIAIILNKDEDEKGLLKFNKMQEWRQWATTLAKKLVEINN